MKKFTILTAVLAVAFNASAQTDMRSDLEKMNLNGQIKSIKETVEGASVNTYTFNDRGYLTNAGQQYVFDSKGRLTMSSSPDGKSIYEYNSKGQLTEFTQKEGDVMYRETYVYDASGKMSACNTSNSKINFSYDNSGNLIHSNDGFGNLLKEYVYDASSRVSMERSGSEVKNYVYDSKGRKTSVSTEKDGKKTVETFAYDNAGFLVKYVVSTSGSVETHNYTVDSTGNWTKDEITTEKGGSKTTGQITREIEYFGAARQLYLLK